MSDSTVSLDWIGATLRAIQAEQRSTHIELELIRRELAAHAGSLVTREMLSEVVRVLLDRFANFEALMETRLDRLEGLITKREG